MIGAQCILYWMQLQQNHTLTSRIRLSRKLIPWTLWWTCAYSDNPYSATQRIPLETDTDCHMPIVVLTERPKAYLQSESNHAFSCRFRHFYSLTILIVIMWTLNYFLRLAIRYPFQHCFLVSSSLVNFICIS